MSVLNSPEHVANSVEDNNKDDSLDDSDKIVVVQPNTDPVNSEQEQGKSNEIDIMDVDDDG